MRYFILLCAFFAVTVYAADDQLVQEALKKSLLLQASKVDVTRFQNYSSRTQLKLNFKTSTAVFNSYTSIDRLPTSTFNSYIATGYVTNSTFSNYTSIDRVPTTRTVNGQALTSDVTITAISGNAGTSTALAANGTNCSAGQSPLGVDASGNSEGCYDVTNQPGWTAPTLLNSWTNYGVYSEAGYKKTTAGTVYLKGFMLRGSTSVIFTLPAEYRPAERRYFPGFDGSSAFAAVYVDTNGDVVTAAGAIFLDGISFQL